MHTIITKLLSALFLISSFIYAEGNYTSFEKISLMLFPETYSWTKVSKVKHAEEALLRKIEPQLRNAYLSSEIIKVTENESCSLIGRIFSSQYKFPENFYIHDLNLDGFDDIIYTGPSHCSEGNITLIWFGKSGGYEIKQDILWHVLAIRVKEGNPVRVSSVAFGCCGDEIDEYLCGPLSNFRIQGIQKVLHRTELPLKLRETESFITQDELVLRSSPETDDQYNSSASEYNEIAIFGNILSKYLPGCQGRITASAEDNKSNLWYFVIIDKASKQLRTHAPFDVCAGWINSNCLKSNKTN